MPVSGDKRQHRGPSPDSLHAYWRKQRMPIVILAIVYAVGIAGMLIPIHPDFIRLTPVNLLFSTALVLAYHQPKTSFFYVFMLICYGLGFLSELIGVQTGLIFGGYTYGEVLGPKMWGTPWMIGVNWLMVTYCAGMTVGLFFRLPQKWALAVLSALLMVGFDLLIEPVAIARGFWDWEGQTIPLQNYVAWFAIGFALQLLFHYRLSYRPNFVAPALLFLQFLFFGILYFSE